MPPWVARWMAQVHADYGVDPRIFFALVVLSMLPFYVAFAAAVGALARSRREATSPLRERTFLRSATIVVLAWLLPYLYVAIFGRLPWWGWAGFMAVVAIGALRLALSLRSRSRRTNESEASGD
ncbi:MAG: hypothetical protein ACYCXZ_08890 [Coriobacteriia bacterium]